MPVGGVPVTFEQDCPLICQQSMQHDWSSLHHCLERHPQGDSQLCTSPLHEAAHVNICTRVYTGRKCNAQPRPPRSGTQSSRAVQPATAPVEEDCG
jgi:hypothetical protein